MLEVQSLITLQFLTKKNDKAISTTTAFIADVLKSQIALGNLNAIMDIFKGG